MIKEKKFKTLSEMWEFEAKKEKYKYYRGEFIKEKIQNAQRRLKEEIGFVINPPKRCPKCNKKFSIMDERGCYCTKHFWIIPHLEERIKSLNKIKDKIFLEEFGERLI